MAPPCIATIFEGDNGGATATGVSGTEIRVAIPEGAECSSVATWMRVPLTALFDYVNSHFEFYGRRLVPVYVRGPVMTGLGARSTAADVAAQNVFGAITGGLETCYGQPSFAADLGRRGIVTITRNSTTWWTDRALYDAYHPTVWSVYPSSEDRQTNLGDFACTALAGRPARHAGDVGLRTATRRFGIVSYGVETAAAAPLLADALAACAGQAPVRVDVTEQSSAADRSAGVERLRAAGVTTMICVCEGFDTINALGMARAANFFPEWILSPLLRRAGEEFTYQDQDPRVSSATIRIDAGPRLLPPQARPWFPALQSVLTDASNGISAADTFLAGQQFYAQLLVLASGIQGAGPALTPDTFAQALMTMQFPNPGAGQAPYWQPSAGFGPGDHSFYDDYNVGWWSPTAPALDLPLSPKSEGSWCYLNQAARFRPGTYPANADDLLYNTNVPCR